MKSAVLPSRIAPAGVSLVLCVLAVCVLMAACSHPTVRASEAAQPNLFDVEIPEGRQADDAARFVAGLPGRYGSPFLELQKESAWQEHAKAMDQAWAAFDRERRPAMQEFARRELRPLPTSGTVFYPFGGPDALTITTFFEPQPRIVMAALEPPGSLPAVKNFQPDTMAAKLAAMRGTMESLLGRSFFITRQMDRQLRGQVTDGVLPDLLVQLVRSGHAITGLREIQLTPEGQIVDRGPAPNGQAWNRGVAIAFQDGRTQAARRLLYFTVNLSNEKLSNNPQFMAALKASGPVLTMLKSTSYLPHQKGFSLIRDGITEVSSAILQDDSGVPYRYFSSGRWNVQLYGEYQQPYGSFRYLVQKDLREAYVAGSGVRTLGFRIGYGFGRVPSNLLLAIAQPAAAARR